MAIKKAYTLIELVIVVGLVSLLAIGISSAALINATIATRTKNVSHLRSTGDYSLSTLQQLVRSSRLILACDSNDNSISLQNPDGGTTAISLELDASVGRIASGSGVYLTPNDVSITNFSLSCLPDDTDPTLVQISFDAELSNASTTRESTTLHFSTSVTPRSD